MHRDELIITVFTLIDDLLPLVTGGQRLRQRGPQPTLADSEVLTIEAVGSFLGFTQDRALWRYFRDHWSHFFPGLSQIHRTTFVRQAAQLWSCKALLWQGVLALTPHDPELSWVDSCPLPVCRFARAYRNRSFAEHGAYGHDAVSRGTFYGFRLHCHLLAPGLLHRLAVVPANVSELTVLPELVADQPGFVLGDRGFWSPTLSAQLRDQQILLVAPFRRATRDPAPRFSRWFSRKRYRIETVFSQLVGRFRVREIRTRDPWHLLNRLLRIMLMHTIGVFLNIQAGRPPLQLARLLD
jgi:hypothetical protein